ncbi:MAG: hypothetical protein FD123_2216 [Bacteroidetes bacterium]|nr:MAG: hypothetical protein FD123_2216 [Bacteroidota bacterium]
MIRGFILSAFFFLFYLPADAQTDPDEDHVQLTMTFRATEGGVHAGRQVRFVNPATGDEVKATTGSDGKIVVLLEKGGNYELYVDNRTGKDYFSVPDVPRGRMNSSTTYSRNELAMAEKFKMDAAEQAEVDRAAAALPDTTWYKSSEAGSLEASAHFALEEITLIGFDQKPLVGELITLTGRKNKKSFKGYTGADGSLAVLLPKGDTYDVNFKYHKNYDILQYEYTKGTSESTLKIGYVGTKEYERIQAEKKHREEEEKKRLEKEKKDFEEACRKAAISVKEGRKRELDDYVSGRKKFSNDVVTRVLGRNKQWTDKLILCDLTGSMAPYASQLEVWYKMNAKLEQKAQFVFFNDGDNKDDRQKIIGETGGIYYTPALPIDELAGFMATVAGKGNGGDCPENNMEALIKGVKMAKPFREIIMIVDNNAAVKDIALLGKFNMPVHIILCGSGGYAAPDYLRIAWKTKGSVHTIEDDIVKIAKMLDGQEITIDGKTYKLMKGEFIPIKKA